MKKKPKQGVVGVGEAVSGTSITWRLPPGEAKDPTAPEWALRERIKELNCLYAVAQLAEQHAAALEKFLQGVVEVLPPSWQYPEITCARIEFKDAVYTSRAFKVSRWRQQAEIMIHGAVVGRVEVYYRKKKPEDYEGPFLREERALLDGVAERIGTIAARMAAEQELAESNRQLTVERQAIQETNAALRAVLGRIEEEKREIHRAIQANVEKILLPILHALAVKVPKHQRKYVDLLRDNLEDMTAPFINSLSQAYRSLTPTEIRICKMIRDGLRTKEIAEMRGVSPATIHRHREHIRRKLGIHNSGTNLTTHLQTTM
jgi:DNA-binding CsgD family transcriptional regulator